MEPHEIAARAYYDAWAKYSFAALRVEMGINFYRRLLDVRQSKQDKALSAEAYAAALADPIDYQGCAVTFAEDPDAEPVFMPVRP